MVHGNRENFSTDEEFAQYQDFREALFVNAQEAIDLNINLTDHSKPIIVWSFYDAPEEFQALSECGGDEDWIVYIHKYNEYVKNCGTPFWIERMSPDCNEYVLPSGAHIIVTSHA